METVLRKTRRKWKFKDRETAEQAWADVNRQQQYDELMVNGLINGKVVWHEGEFGDETGHYRFGMLARKWDIVYVQTYYSHLTDQAPNSNCYGEQQLEKILEGCRMCFTGLDSAYRDGLYAIKEMGRKALA